MAVTFKKNGQIVSGFGKSATQSAVIEEQLSPAGKGKVGMTHSLKLPQAIKDPHQFHYKAQAADKAKLKVLAAQQGVTLMGMLAGALTAFLDDPDGDVPTAQAPAGAARIIFKVTPELAQRVREYAKDKNLSYQSIIQAAVDRLHSGTR